MDIVILLILTLLSLLTIYCLYMMLNKRGLYFSLIIMNLLSLVLSFKITYVFNMNINLGIVPFISSLSILYIFLKKYGYQDNKNLIKISLISNIASSLLLIVMNYYVPAVTETVSINIQGTFEYNYKILIVYPIIEIISQIAVIKMYKLISQILENMYFCVILSYIITGLIYTVLMYLLFYIDIIEIKYSLFLGISTYILGLVLTIINSLLINFLTTKKVIQQ